MAKELRIYPRIGIARLGNHPDSFFLSPEVADIGPLELTADGSITAVTAHRADGQVRRQGARFRVYEVDSDASGAITQFREITADEAEIEWHVELANQKAAAGRFRSEDTPEDDDIKRNPGVDSDKLIIRPQFPGIAGKDQFAAATNAGQFKGQDVYLGELRTDGKGRLIVLGGRGQSASVPAGKPIGDEVNPSGNDFANNEFWHDDVSDGPVSATVKLPGMPAIELKDAWVIVAPPDFAPYTLGVVTLYDVAYDAAVRNGHLAASAEPSFKRDILPILKAVSNYRWVSNFSFWETFPMNWSELGSKANNALRQEARSKLDQVAGGLIANLSFTRTQRRWLNLWRDGTFVEDFAAADVPGSINPEGLDRASLTQGVGGGFFPGIEAGIITTYTELYQAPFRITREPFEHDGRAWAPSPGFLTRNMACPWQADFWECKWQGPDSIWWPAQRPLHVRRSENQATKIEWDRGIGAHRDLVEHAMDLGFISKRIAGNDGVFETERALIEV
ncbi:LodA/GoxA family CTQ-dependent oxidase [Bradyrhizobium sp. JYMT SZCCT0428]|uniref:LodA/GoxA family CTQ-dependent oxidase n=1 Tax=Bradyrhizobium sp. JYMT SZCCT0428 TaxID=2807673 RepID=UPI001BADAF09|nr:LodA/GoxA family CTQ-dependent oxidase [Bradyrhizobium sp. JYMT SZCCT0428]MBR1154273.1 LodA/GoxA family CTQ-dependent oxidase [Bradyrhizobium sp. JYMT SZCCT0428]